MPKLGNMSWRKRLAEAKDKERREQINEQRREAVKRELKKAREKLNQD